MPELAGCVDIDVWPTPFTNTFPIRRQPLALGERREFVMAWVSAPELTFENLDGNGFRAELAVDEDGVVLDYEP